MLNRFTGPGINYKEKPAILIRSSEFEDTSFPWRVQFFNLLIEYERPWSEADAWVIFMNDDEQTSVYQVRARWPISMTGWLPICDSMAEYNRLGK